jgi:hypothetical protein
MTSRNDESVQYVSVNDKGLKLVGLRHNKLHPIEFYSWSKVVSVLASKTSSTTTDLITITLGNGQKLTLHCDYATNMQRTCDTFFMNDVKASKRENQSSHHLGHPTLSEHGGHINMMKSAATMQNNQSRVLSMGLAHHQIQSSSVSGTGGREGSYGDEMDSTIGLEFNEDLDEISTTPTGGQSHTHTHFSRKMAASYYDHNNHHHGGEEDEQMMDFHVSFYCLIVILGSFIHSLST